MANEMTAKYILQKNRGDREDPSIIVSQSHILL